MEDLTIISNTQFYSLIWGFLLCSSSNCTFMALTVPCRLNRLFGHLWYKVGVLWHRKNCLKSSQKRSFSICPNKHGLDLSKEVLLVPPQQRAAKLQAIKLWAARESNPGRPESNDSLYKVANGVASNPKGLELYLITNFEGPYFCSRLS